MQQREYVSPDRQFTFLITCPGGDLTMGFAGFPWHTHGSIVAGMFSCGEKDAVDRLVAELVGNISVMTICRLHGRITDVWISDDPSEDLASHEKYGESGETVEFRLWDGTPVTVQSDHTV
jgi:hypothetical protein